MCFKQFFQTIFTLTLTIIVHGQVSMTAVDVAYTQNFNSLSAGSDASSFTWSNNTTLTGWYVSPTSVTVESSTSSMNNTGAPYQIVSGADKSIGARASGTSPNNNIYIGMRLKNNTGQMLSAIDLSYYGEQWSIAENQSNVNKLYFAYQISSSSITSLTSGSWTNVSSADFTQLYTSSQSSSMGGSACTGTSAQCLALNGNASANRRLISVTIPLSLAPGEELMLRWYDLNDAANDHHLQIDDISVTPRASVILPVTLTSFHGICSNDRLNFSWSVGSELQLDKYLIEFSADGQEISELGEINRRPGDTDDKKYEFSVAAEQNNGYYRLTTVDLNGTRTSYNWIALSCESGFYPEIYPNPSQGVVSISGLEGTTQIYVYNSLGKLCMQTVITEGNQLLDLHQLAEGMYTLVAQYGNKTAKLKLSLIR